MTTGHRIKPKILRKRKRLKKTALNARITRESFSENPTKILPIPTFIDDYNHYMGGGRSVKSVPSRLYHPLFSKSKEILSRSFLGN
jgi:hypothetical protein